MKNNPLTTILLAVLAMSAIWSAILCVRLISHTRELRMSQGPMLEVSRHEAIDQAVLNDAVAYSTNHPAILPIVDSLIQSLGLKRAGAAPVVPAPAVKPANH